MADKKIMSQGVGESKVHAALDPTKPEYDWATLTINGDPIPEELWPNMRFSLTDQGHEADRAKKLLSTPGITVAKDKDDKKVDIYAEGLKTGNLVMGQDPLEIAMKENLPAGHSGLWIGPRKEKENGLVRGILKFEPVLVKNPQTGNMERVQQNGMYLASVPIAARVAADQYYKDMGEAKLQKSVENVQEQVDRLPGMTDRIRARSGNSLEGITVDDADAADAEMAPALMHESA